MQSTGSNLVLYHAWVSSASRRVRFALEEKELPYQSVLVDLKKFEQHSPEYLAINPNGFVPTLLHEGIPVIESSVICEYLDDVFPRAAAAAARPAGAGADAGVVEVGGRGGAAGVPGRELEPHDGPDRRPVDG